MSLWRQLARGLRALADREATDRDIADEVQHFLDEAVDSLIAGGLSPAEARRRARLEYGSQSTIREQVRSYGWENLVEEFLTDLRYAARRLRKAPGFATVSLLTVAIGVGAITAIVSAVKPVLFEPLPYPGSDRIVMVSDFLEDGSSFDVAFGTYREVTERSRSFTALGVMKPWGPTLSGAMRPERLNGQRVSAEYFRVLGVAPALGRPFDASNDRVGGPDVAIIGDALWRGRFGGDSAIVGREITLDGSAYTVIGVMPSGFQDAPSPTAEIWSLLQYDASPPSFQTREWGRHLRMLGRLQPGIGVDEARRELDAIAGQPVAGYPRPPWASLERGFHLSSLKDAVTRDVQAALLAILGAVVLLLVIACANVTNLLLGRVAQRREEFAMRVALGAGQSRLIRQLLTESSLLAVLGGVVGVALAAFGVSGLVALGPSQLPRVHAITMDGSVFAIALGITALIAAVIGLVPALRAARSDPQQGLRQGSRRTIGGRRGARSALVVAEVAMTLVLLVGAGLLLRSLGRILAVEPGFRPTGVLTFQVQTSGPRYDDDGATHRFFERALDAVRSVPGVTEAALTSLLPLSGESDMYGVQSESSPSETSEGDRGALRYAVSPNYFRTMGIPLLRGRPLAESDASDAPGVVVISESLARSRFPGQDAIGRRVHVGRTDLPSYAIVGVVGDVIQTSLATSDPGAVYVTPWQWYFADAARWFVVRAAGDPAALVPALRDAVWSVDPDQPVVRVELMDDLVAASAAQRRFVLVLFAAFALAALTLAMVGLYGVLSGSVAERMREMGVRSALGATRGDLLGLVVREGLELTGLGVVIGLGGAVVMSQALVTLLFGISRLDPITYGGVIVLLTIVSGMACAVPAARAARVDPVRTLNSE